MLVMELQQRVAIALRIQSGGCRGSSYQMFLIYTYWVNKQHSLMPSQYRQLWALCHNSLVLVGSRACSFMKGIQWVTMCEADEWMMISIHEIISIMLMNSLCPQTSPEQLSLSYKWHIRISPTPPFFFKNTNNWGKKRYATLTKTHDSFTLS